MLDTFLVFEKNELTHEFNHVSMFVFYEKNALSDF